MRMPVLLPLSTAVVATVGLALPTTLPTTFPTSLPVETRPAPPGATRATEATGAASAVPEGAVPQGAVPQGAVPQGASASPTSPAVPASPTQTRPLGRWGWPLSPRPTVVRPFLRPSSAYGAGHRGLDLGVAGGQAVLAVEAGTVTHVGVIAGRGTVTVLHASGIRSTYEPVAATVTTGQAVAAGSALGRLTVTASHCVAACLHLGAVRGETYLDPMTFLVGGRRVRLLPLAQAPASGSVAQVPVGQVPEG